MRRRRGGGGRKGGRGGAGGGKDGPSDIEISDKVDGATTPERGREGKEKIRGGRVMKEGRKEEGREGMHVRTKGQRAILQSHRSRHHSAC